MFNEDTDTVTTTTGTSHRTSATTGTGATTGVSTSSADNDVVVTGQRHTGPASSAPANTNSNTVTTNHSSANNRASAPVMVVAPRTTTIPVEKATERGCRLEDDHCSIVLTIKPSAVEGQP